MLTQGFFEQDAPDLSQSLLGCKITHKSSEGIVSGIIVETEAYSQEDAASHSYRGQTERTKVMFGPAGYIYIYFTYGMHHCFNIVSGTEGHGQAVLIRALEPIDGIEIMKKRRNKTETKDLCSGPAKLVQAMGFTRQDYGRSLFTDSLYLEKLIQKPPISRGPRIGISEEKEKPWRFWITESDFIPVKR